jgi:hypothetical protein
MTWAQTGANANGHTSWRTKLRFIAEEPNRKRVEVKHRRLDRHGEGWDGMRNAVGSPEGWAVGLQRFAQHVGSVAARS